MIYRQATLADLPEVTQLMTDSFLEYPAYTIAFEGEFSTKEKYEAFLNKINRLEILSFIKQNSCYIGVLDRKIVSLALLESPVFKESSILGYIFNGGYQLLPSYWIRNLGKFLHLMEKADEKCKEERKKGAWYLKVLAVHQEVQGQQIGSKMLEECVIPTVRKQKGTRLLLITNTKRNCQFYMKNQFTEFSYQELTLDHKILENWVFERIIE